MRYARLQDDKVVELMELDRDPVGLYHPSLAFRAAPEGCAEGWILSGDALIAPPVDLEALRATKRVAIDAAFMARVAAGASHDGHVYQIDSESRGNIASRATRAGLFLSGVGGVTWPEDGMPFRTKANIWLTFTPEAFLSLAQKVDDDFTLMRIRYAELKDACATADVAGLTTLDPSADWPVGGAL